MQSEIKEKKTERYSFTVTELIEVLNREFSLKLDSEFSSNYNNGTLTFIKHEEKAYDPFNKDFSDDIPF